MVTAAKAGRGTLLARAGFTIAEGITIGDYECSTEMKDVTSHDSTGLREFIPLLREYSDFVIGGNFIAGDTNGQIGLQADQAAGTLQTFVLTLPTTVTATVSFSAYVSKFKIGGLDVDGNQTFSATLKISGAATMAITASNNITVLAVTTGTLVPTFAAATYSYVAHVLTGAATVTMTATFAAGTATLTYGTSSQTLTTTVPSSAITLGAAGSLTVVTIVVRETSKVAVTYTIWVERA